MSEAAAINHSPDFTSMRRWERYNVNVPIRVIVSRAMKASIFDGAELRPGDQVAVEFTPPFSSPPIRVDARICNRTGYHYGVEFLAVDNAQRQSVAQLRQHLSSFTIMA